MEKCVNPFAGPITVGLSQAPKDYVAPVKRPPDTTHKVHPNAHSLPVLAQAMKANPSSTTFTIASDIEPAFTLMIGTPTLGRSDGKGTVPNPHYFAKKVVVDPTMAPGTWKLT